MAFDGIFLHHLCKELETVALNSRVDKIYQPAREDIVIVLRTATGIKKLFISSRSDSGRIHFTEKRIENPEKPPMLCMLFRKHLLNAKLVNITQLGLDRMLKLSFDGVNNIGDKTTLHLMVELMGKHSNIILLNDENKIIDATKRIGIGNNAARIILPGIKYELPPMQNKLSLLQCDLQTAVAHITEKATTTKTTADAILSTILGLSPITSREIDYRAGINNKGLEKEIKKLQELIQNTAGTPYLVLDKDKKPLDMAFLEIRQYNNHAICEQYQSFNQLLDEFFDLRADTNRINSLTKELTHKVNSIKSKLAKKINKQQLEIAKSKQRDKLKIYADVLSANIFMLKKGMQSIELYNFYEDKNSIIPLNPLFTPSQNIQHYYKRYKKAITAEKTLTEEIQKATDELKYLDTITEEIERITTGDELAEIQQELYEQGYLTYFKAQSRKLQKTKPMRFLSSNGNDIFVGRNNKENDYLTLKFAQKTDLWFHIKEFAGAHVILKLKDNKLPTDKEIYEAGCLAASNSKAKTSSKVAIDYTFVKNVKKPKGAKPGMVIYVDYKTIFANPYDALTQ